MATAELQGDQANLPPGWIYSLKFHIPDDAFASPTVDGIDAPIAGMELVGIGSGVVVTPAMVVSSSTIFGFRKILRTPRYGTRLRTRTERVWQVQDGASDEDVREP